MGTSTFPHSVCILIFPDVREETRGQRGFVDADVPGEVLLVLSLLPSLPGLSHVRPVGERLQQTTDVLVFRPGSTDGELLVTLHDGPENTPNTDQTVTLPLCSIMDPDEKSFASYYFKALKCF